MLSWDSPHFHSSSLGHLLQPQVFLFSMSSSRRNRLDCVGVLPDTNLCTQSQVRHHRLHSERLSCSCDASHSASAVLSARVACVLDQGFTTVPLIIMPPLVDFLSGPVAHVNLPLVAFPCPHRPRHLFCSFQSPPTALCRIRHHI